MKEKKTKQKAAVRGNRQNISNAHTLIGSSVFGLLVTLVICAILLICGTAAAFFSDDPTALTEPIGYTSLLASAFLGGFACAKINRDSSLLPSILTALLFALFTTALSLALPDKYSAGISVGASVALRISEILAFPLGTAAGKWARLPARRKARKKH